MGVTEWSIVLYALSYISLQLAAAVRPVRNQSNQEVKLREGVDINCRIFCQVRNQSNQEDKLREGVDINCRIFCLRGRVVEQLEGERSGERDWDASSIQLSGAQSFLFSTARCSL